MSKEETTENRITYSSAVDLWLIVVGFGPLIYLLYASAAGNAQIGWAGLFVLLLIYAGVGAFLFPMRYTLTKEHLIIQAGLPGQIYKQKIELAKITDVSLSHNPLSAPALSLKRIKIELEGGFWGFTLISPKDRRGFIEDLNRRREALRAERREP